MGVFEEAARLERENRPFALATILRAKGSTPRNEGAMIIRSDGSALGTVGGGAMELYVLEQALEAMAEGNSRIVSRELFGSGEASTGMECGGTMEVHIHVVKPKPRLLLVGGGHVNLAIARVAALLEFDLAVAEERPDFATSERFPMARKFHVAPDIRQAIDQAEVDEETSIIIATKAEDIEAAEVALRSPAGYVGMLGSKRKVALATKQLREAGIPERRIAEFHAPIGLDIGAETPAEIALSVLSEILAFRDRRSGQSLKKMIQDLVVIRGAGDMATGTAWRLRRSGFPVVCLETTKPTVIRRTVSFASALYEGEIVVEGVRAVRAEGVDELYEILEAGDVPVLSDPECESLETLKPAVLVDAILAKRNLGTHRGMAPITVALGPGFRAPEDVDAVIETNRGHSLGRVIFQGEAEANTGVPGTIGGESARRVVRAPSAGVFNAEVSIGDIVKEGEILGSLGTTKVPSPLSGLVRGLLASGIEVTEGFKIGDVDPRGASVDWKTVSDKARAVAGGVLEAILYLKTRSREEVVDG